MWLSDLREREGLSLDELGRAIRLQGRAYDPPIGCSDTLLHRLEVDRNFVTHPKIANLIAVVCGATAEQRDELVLKDYRGDWVPEGPPLLDMLLAILAMKPTMPAEPEAPDPTVHGPVAKAVVAVDKEGKEVSRYPSAMNAAIMWGQSEDCVRKRCQKKIQNEFSDGLKVTFRYAIDYDRLPPDRRKADLCPRHPNTIATRGGQNARPVVVVFPGGEVRRFVSAKEAWEKTTEVSGLTRSAVFNRLCGQVQNTAGDACQYHYAEEWDAREEEAGESRASDDG